jgi:23S rRNA pseudouridine955/2504/2580 synthase
MKRYQLSDLVIFENDDYLIVDKPPFLSSLDERLGNAMNLLKIVRADLPEAKLGHRLDKETSGAVAIAKHFEAYRHLSIQFQERQVEKVYNAIAIGVHDFQEKAVEVPLHKMKNGLSAVNYKQGKHSLTFFSTLEAFRHYTLLECRPITGRLHQIRVHAQVLGAPLVADKAYGGKDLFLSEIKRKKFNLKKWEEELPLMQRVALHAKELGFKGLNGESIKAVTEYPKDFSALLRQLKKFDM